MDLKDCSLFINLAAGGSELITEILNTYGSSVYFKGTQIVHDMNYTRSIINSDTTKFVSFDVSEQLASDAFIKASEYASDGQIPVGIGITCSLEKENQRLTRRNCAYYTIIIGNKVYRNNLELNNKYKRKTQSIDVATHIMAALKRLMDFNLIPDERADLTRNEGIVYISNKLGHVNFLFDCSETIKFPAMQNTIIFPITGNPIHWGHLKTRQLIEKMLGKKVVFEISRKHPIKGNIPLEIINKACKDCYLHADLIISDFGLYKEKFDYYKRPIIMGDDQFDILRGVRWWDIDAYPFYVINRTDNFDPIDISLNGGIPLFLPKMNISSTMIRNKNV